MKNIIFFHPKNDYTGSTRALYNLLCEEYVNYKEISVITSKNENNGFLSLLPNVKIINIYDLKYKGKDIFFLSFFVRRLHSIFLTFLYGWKYKTFYINTIRPYYAALVGRLYGKKIIWHVHEKFLSQRVSVRMMEGIFESTSAHRIFVSEYVKNQYSANNKCTWEIRYNRLPSEFLNKVKNRAVEKRSRNKLLMIASLSKDKGVDMFINLAHHIQECHFRLILNANKDNINDFFSQVIIPPNCELIPKQSNIQPFLEDTDLILNLSDPLYWVETFGLTILEAMPYGIPAIVPNVGGPTELIENGYNGYCVDVSNLESLVENIRLSLVEANYNRLAENTYKRFDLKFK